jgi:AraC-like DNA-binding protein
MAASLDTNFPDTINRDAAGIPLAMARLDAVEPHSHHKAELIHLISGNLTVETANGIWLIPPGRALFLPPDTPHWSTGTGNVTARCIFLRPDLSLRLPDRCHLVFVHPLLREIMLRLTQMGLDDDIDRVREKNLVAVLLDELPAARTEPFHLPLPGDRRLRQIADSLIRHPDRRRSIDQWCTKVGTSPRTLRRLFQRDVGMSLATWRQLLHVQVAVRDLECRKSVSSIAFDLGYESPSAFIAMFKRNTGQTPGALVQEGRAVETS